MTYNSTLPKVFVYLLTTIETLYQTSVPLEVQNRKNVHLATSDCLVIACYLWGVLHFSETLKAKQQLAQSLFPNFLEYSRFVRHCNALLPSIQLIRQALVFKEVEGIDVSIIDSFPIPLCQPIRNFRSKVLGDYANIGYNATNDAHFETRAEATQEIFKYIETYYNTKRMHSALDYKSPKDFEKYNS